MQHEIVWKLKKVLFKKWQAQTSKCDVQFYFYVISQNNKGWGVVMPEMLGVIKHSIANNYRVCFIANPGSNVEVLRLFDNVSCFDIWERFEFIHLAEVEIYARQLEISIGNSDKLRQLLIGNLGFNNLFPIIPDFNWPFSDLLRCIIHNTEFVHPDFTLFQSNFTHFTNLCFSGFESKNMQIKLKHENILKAQQLLKVDDSPRFVLTIREAPAYHGTDRDTEPEELDQLLQEAAKFTNKINLIGTKPSTKLISVISKYDSLIKIFDHTFTHYEVANYSQTDSNGNEKQLINTYLLTTPNVKMIAPTGIVTLISASGQFYGIFNTPNIFFQHQSHVISCPRRFSQLPNLSPLKAFIFGLSTMPDGEWFWERFPANPVVVFSAIENLLNQINSSDLDYLHTESIFNPKLLNTIRKELVSSPKILEHADLSNFGAHLIQDMPGQAIRYS